MPAHQQLSRAIGAGPRRFAFADHGMAREVQSFFGTKRVTSLNILALHRGFAEVVQQRRREQRTAIVTREMKRVRDVVGNRGDTLRMRILVTLEAIDSLRELRESVACFFLNQFESIDCGQRCLS